MRRRLLLSVLSVAAVAVVLLGVPLAVAGAIVRVDVAKAQVQARAESIGRVVDEAVTAGRDVDEALISSRLPGTDEATVSLASGPVLHVGGEPSGGYLSGAYASSTVDVTVRRDRSQLNGDILRVVGLVATLSVVALAAALVMGLAEARRLTRPMVDLAQTAGRLGSGSGRPPPVRYGIEEVDRVAEVLERSSERIAVMLAAERQFASDASHQLRTPLTALSMRLEEIAGCDDLHAVHEEAKVALTQVERLSAVVDHLLANARQTRSAGAALVDVDVVVNQQVEEWRPSFSAVQRDLQVRGPRGVVALATPAGLSQVLATLLENSLVHGGGTVTVSTRTTGLSVVIEVADEGPGVPPELGARVFERSVSGHSRPGHSGTGLGLALARDLAEADGGRLELVRQSPAVFALFLSAPEAPSASSSAAASSSSAAGNTQRR